MNNTNTGNSLYRLVNIANLLDIGGESLADSLYVTGNLPALKDLAAMALEASDNVTKPYVNRLYNTIRDHYRNLYSLVEALERQTNNPKAAAIASHIRAGESTPDEVNDGRRLIDQVLQTRFNRPPDRGHSSPLQPIITT